MIRNKGKPMYDPDDQWIDKESVKTMMRAYRLSPETLGKMADTKSMATDSVPVLVRYVGPFRFTFYVMDENRNMFVDVHEPKLGMHLVHADWRNFMVVAQETAKELEEVRGTTLPADFRMEIAKLDKRLDILEKAVSGLKTRLDAPTQDEGPLEERLHKLEVRFASCQH